MPASKGNELTREIGVRLKQVRKHLDMSQNDFSFKVGSSQAHISQIELGLFANMNADLLMGLTELKIDLNWLITGNKFAKSKKG